MISLVPVSDDECITYYFTLSHREHKQDENKLNYKSLEGLIRKKLTGPIEKILC